MPNPTPSKMSMERSVEILRPIPSTDIPICEINGDKYFYMSKKELSEKFALAFDRLIEEGCQVVRHWDISKGGYGLLEQAIRLKLKGGEE